MQRLFERLALNALVISTFLSLKLSYCHVLRNDHYAACYKHRDMVIDVSRPASIVEKRIKELREQLGWPQEKIGVAIGINESSSRARISRYELGVHEPPVATARLIALALGAPLSYLYCEDDKVAALLLALHHLEPAARDMEVTELLVQLTT